MNINFKNSELHTVLVFFIFAIIALTPLKILSLLAVLFLIAVVIPFKDNFFVRLLLAYAVFFASNTILGAIFYMLSLPATSISFLLIQLTFILCLLLINKPTLKRPRIGLSDLTKIITSVMIVGIITVPPILKGLSVFSVVSSGGDNLSHIELLLADSSKKGYFYAQPQETELIMSKNLAGYPQGLHLNMYLISDSFKPIVDIAKHPRLLLSFYYVYTISLFVLFSWLFMTASKLSEKLTSVSIAVTSILFSGLFFSLFALGFQTQIASYVLFLALFIVLEKLYDKDYTAKHKELFGLLAVLLTGAISFTWLFLLPIAFFVVAYALIDSFRLWDIQVIKLKWKFILKLILVGSFTAIQPIVQLLFSNKNLSGVNEIGFTTIIPTLIIVAVSFLGFLYFIIPKNNRSRVAIATLFISILFSISIYAYQILRVGEPRYYYHKSIFTIVIIVAILLTRLSVHMLSSKSLKNISYMSSIIIILFGFSITLYNLTNKLDYFSIHRSGGISHELVDTAVRHVVVNPADTVKVIAIGSCNRAQDHTLTRLVGVISQQNSYPRQALLAGILEPSSDSLLRAISKYQDKTKSDLIIYSTDKPTADALKERLKGGPNEVFVDLDFGHVKKNKYTCPNAVK